MTTRHSSNITFGKNRSSKLVEVENDQIEYPQNNQQIEQEVKQDEQPLVRQHNIYIKEEEQQNQIKEEE